MTRNVAIVGGGVPISFVSLWYDITKIWFTDEKPKVHAYPLKNKHPCVNQGLHWRHFGKQMTSSLCDWHVEHKVDERTSFGQFLLISNHIWVMTILPTYCHMGEIHYKYGEVCIAL